MKKWLLFLVLSCLFLSCTLNVTNEEKGDLSLKLPDSNTSRSISSFSELPNEYLVTLESLSTKKNVYKQYHKAGSIVSVPDLLYGKYEISILGNASGQSFSGTQTVEVKGKTNSVKITLQATPSYGDLKLIVNSPASHSLSSYYYNIINSKGEYIKQNEKIDMSSSPKEILIPHIFSGSLYKIEVFGADSNYIYKGEGIDEKVFIKPNEQTELTISSFVPYTGNIEFTTRSDINNPIKYTIYKENTNTVIKTGEIPSLSVSSSYIVDGIKGGNYYITFTSDNKKYDYEYEGTFTISEGYNSSLDITSTPKKVCYVRSDGDDSFLGTEDKPYRTINAAINAISEPAIKLSVVLLDSITEDVIIGNGKVIEISGKDNNVLIKGSLSIDNSSSLTLSNISNNNITVTNGTLTLKDNVKLGNIKLQPSQYINVSGVLLNSQQEKINVTLSSYNIGEKIVNSSLSSEIPKFTLANNTYVLDSNGICEKIAETVKVTLSDFDNYKANSVSYTLLNDKGGVLEEDVLSNAQFSPTTPLFMGKQYKLVVSGKTDDYTYENTISITGGDATVTFPPLEVITGGMAILEGTASPIVSSITLKSGEMTKEYTCDTLPYRVFDLKPGIYEVTVNSSNTDEIIDPQYFSVGKGSITQASLTARPNNVVFVESGGLDSNSGTAKEPFSNMSKAIETVNKFYGTNNLENYSIKIKGNTTLTESIKFDSDIKITLEGIGEGATITGNGSERLILLGTDIPRGSKGEGVSFTSPNLTIKNLTLTGGKGDGYYDDTAGSAIKFVSGSLTLGDKTVIQGNSCWEDAFAGIYVTPHITSLSFSGNVNTSIDNGIFIQPKTEGSDYAEHRGDDVAIPTLKTIGDVTGQVYIKLFQDEYSKGDVVFTYDDETKANNADAFVLSIPKNLYLDKPTGTLKVTPMTATEALAWLTENDKNDNKGQYKGKGDLVIINSTVEDLKAFYDGTKTLTYTGNINSLDLSNLTEITEVPDNFFYYNNGSHKTTQSLVLPPNLEKLGFRAFDFYVSGWGTPTFIPESVYVIGGSTLGRGPGFLFADKYPWRLSENKNSDTVALFTPTDNAGDNSNSMTNVAGLSAEQYGTWNKFRKASDIASIIRQYTGTGVLSVYVYFETPEEFALIKDALNNMKAGSGTVCVGIYPKDNMIPDKAFEGCTKLSKAILVEPIKNIGKMAFSNSGLNDISIDAGCDWYDSQNVSKFNSSIGTGWATPIGQIVDILKADQADALHHK